MKLLLSLLFITSTIASLAQNKVELNDSIAETSNDSLVLDNGPLKCSDIEALVVVNMKDVPSDYNGVAVLCNERGDVTRLTTFKNGKKNGIEKNWNGESKLIRVSNWEMNLEQGAFLYWDRNGQLVQERNFKRGRLEGPSRKWHGNGQLNYEVNYSFGRIMDARVDYFDEEGKKYQTRIYERGSLVGCEGDCDRK